MLGFVPHPNLRAYVIKQPVTGWHININRAKKTGSFIAVGFFTNDGL
jgi:hypothetical protein